MLTVIGLGYAIYDYPEMVEDMVETMCQVVEFALDQLLPHFKFDLAESWEDICFNHGPLVSVDFFKNVIVPRYKRIHKKLMAYGIDIWRMDCDGNIWPLIPCFIEGGANCMFPLEVNGSGHPREIIEKYEGQLVFMGGIDKIQLIAGPEAIKEYLKSIEKYVVKGGFIPFVDHNVPPDVKPENYLYYLDLKEKMFGMG
jgi:uroporphyrinogen decarboxylase